MSTVLPSDNAQLLQWGDDHAPVFASNALAIGLSAAQATTFGEVNKDMHLAWLAYGDAKSKLAAAATAWKNARAAIRTLAGADVGLIKNFAERQPVPETVYSLAQIPAPAPRTPGVPPTTATDPRAALDTETGQLTIRWSAAQPKGVNGVVYQVQRALGGGTNFSTAGLTGAKNFIDDNIPAGTARILYRIVSQRGSLVSPASSTLDVRLSTNAAGEMAITSVKLAA